MAEGRAEATESTMGSRVAALGFWLLLPQSLLLIGGLVYVVTDHPGLSALALFVMATASGAALRGPRLWDSGVAFQAATFGASLFLAAHELSVNDYYFKPQHVRLLMLAGLPGLALAMLLARGAPPSGSLLRTVQGAALFAGGWLIWRSDQGAHIAILGVGLRAGTLGSLAAAGLLMVLSLQPDMPPTSKRLARRGAACSLVLMLLGVIANTWAFVDFRERTRQRRTCATLRLSAIDAVVSYGVDHDGPPSTGGSLVPLTSVVPPLYLQRGSDAWERPLLYLSNGKDFLVASMGSGRP